MPAPRDISPVTSDKGVIRLLATDIIKTPAMAMAMASNTPEVARSPRNTRPNRAA